MCLVFDTWFRVLVIFTVAKLGCAVRIVCETSTSCSIRKINTNADLFVQRFIPRSVIIVYFHNFGIDHADTAFFNTIPAFIMEVYILNSPHIKWLTVPQQSNVSVLNIAYTGLRRIDMEKNNALTQISIVKSNIAEVSPSISNLQSCREVSIIRCLIESVDLGTFCDMSMLQVLNFHANRITHIQNSAKTNCSLYDSLETLTLSHNLLKSLNMALFHTFRILKILHMNENNIEAVFGRYETDASLSISLKNNCIKTFDVCEWNVPHMIYLNLQHNNLTTVPDCLEKFISVSELVLSFNQIANVAIESFAKMDSLQRLFLASNNMTTISFNTARYPRNLKKVWISDNNLTELDLSLVAVPSLEIQVIDNFIENFDISKVSTNVTTLCMSNNPIDCSWRTIEERLNFTCLKDIICF